MSWISPCIKSPNMGWVAWIPASQLPQWNLNTKWRNFHTQTLFIVTLHDLNLTWHKVTSWDLWATEMILHSLIFTSVNSYDHFMCETQKRTKEYIHNNENVLRYLNIFCSLIYFICPSTFYSLRKANLLVLFWLQELNCINSRSLEYWFCFSKCTARKKFWIHVWIFPVDVYQIRPG